MAILDRVLNGLADNASQVASSTIGAFFNANQSRLAHEREQYMLNRSFDLSEQAAQAAYEREIAADSTKYQRQVADLQAAGLNPMLAAGQSAGAVHSSPASGSPGSAPMSSANINLGSMIESQRLDLQRRQAEADIKLKEAEARNLDERTTGEEIRNWINNQTKEDQAESIRLENELKEGKIRLTDSEISDIRSKVSLRVQQEKSEQAKQAADMAAAALSRASAFQIVSLLPYQKSLLEAQTDNQRAAAALAWAHEAYQSGLIENGYLESFCRQAAAAANVSESEASIAGIQAAIQSGDYSNSGIMKYVPGLSEAITGLKNAFDVVGSLVHVSYGSRHVSRD